MSRRVTERYASFRSLVEASAAQFGDESARSQAPSADFPLMHQPTGRPKLTDMNIGDPKATWYFML
jgi:hypothetical protein